MYGNCGRRTARKFAEGASKLSLRQISPCPPLLALQLCRSAVSDAVLTADQTSKYGSRGRRVGQKFAEGASKWPQKTVLLKYMGKPAFFNAGQKYVYF
jgi:hypothetical protein